MTAPRPPRVYRLLDGEGKPFTSAQPGTWGGHRRLRTFGRLDCPSALRWLAAGHYARHRVFFADEATARAAGYRPCAVCLPTAYREWLGRQTGTVTADPAPGDPKPAARGLASPTLVGEQHRPTGRPLSRAARGPADLVQTHR